MTTPLSLSVIELIVLMLGAITLGITINFFIVSRRSLKATVAEVTGGKTAKELTEWKSRYFNDIELRDKELTSLKQQLADAEENSHINTIEADEMRKLNKKLRAEMESSPKAVPGGEQPEYIEQLRLAQTNLLEQSKKINLLLEQIDIVKGAEAKQREILKDNEELSGKIIDLGYMLSQKEKEITSIRQKELLTSEMRSMLDGAYNEFSVLQDKISKLEGQVMASKMNNLEFEDLKEGYYKVRKDFEEQKLKYNTVTSENHQLQDDLAETEAKLREANFQRQQLQKRVAYLEELNEDMQAVADANKKLEGQIRRIGELESMLNVVAEERDELARKQMNA